MTKSKSNGKKTKVRIAAKAALILSCETGNALIRDFGKRKAYKFAARLVKAAVPRLIYVPDAADDGGAFGYDADFIPGNALESLVQACFQPGFENSINVSLARRLIDEPRLLSEEGFEVDAVAAGRFIAAVANYLSRLEGDPDKAEELSILKLNEFCASQDQAT